jgi:hypothetical protein
VTFRRHDRCTAFCTTLLGVACAAEHPRENGQRSATNAPTAAPASGAAEVVPAPPPSASTTAREAPIDDGAPRAYAKTRFVWIRSEPDIGTDWIGFLWSGGSTKLKSAKPRPGPGCETWYAVEPRGFVCVDGRRVTLDSKDPALAALRAHGPDLSSPRPHRYGESIGLERYETLPTPEIQKARERGFETHQKRVLAARAGENDETLRGIDLSVSNEAPPELPEFVPSVHEGRLHLLRRSTVAYTREVRWGDRGFLLAGDYTWVPKDR